MDNQVLSDLEQKLNSQLGKKLRYLNLIKERFGNNASETDKISVAMEVLNGPWLGVLGALAESKNLKSEL